MKPETKIVLEQIKLVCVFIVSLLLEICVAWASAFLATKCLLLSIIVITLGIAYIPPTIDVVITCVSSIEREKEKFEERNRKPINE